MQVQEVAGHSWDVATLCCDGPGAVSEKRDFFFLSSVRLQYELLKKITLILFYFFKFFS